MKIFFRYFFIVFFWLVLAGAVQAQRWVSINNQYLSPQQLRAFDQMTGNYTPNGHYWLNMQTGAWGYIGNLETQGYIGQQRRPAERNPVGENPGVIRRGPFGTYMSDGECSFVLGVPVGNCN